MIKETNQAKGFRGKSFIEEDVKIWWELNDEVKSMMAQFSPYGVPEFRERAVTAYVLQGPYLIALSPIIHHDLIFIFFVNLSFCYRLEATVSYL